MSEMEINARQAEEATEVSSEGVRTLPDSVLNRAMWRHLLTLQWSWNYERMQALGYLYSMLPVINHVYTDKEEKIAAMKRHLAFYNTNPLVGSPTIFGATVALEAQKEGEVVDSLKVGLMGPLAGIGDTLTGILFRPLVGVLAAGLALQLNILGPILMFVASIVLVAIMIPQFWFGYRQGINVAKEVAEGGMVARFTELATIAGLFVIGGFAPSILSGLKTGLTYEVAPPPGLNEKVRIESIQPALDALLPFAIPVLLIGFAYLLLQKFKLSPLWVLLILIVVGFVLAQFKILAV